MSGDAGGEKLVPLPPQTTRQLMELVLRWSGLDLERPLPADFIESLRQIVSLEAGLGGAAQRYLAGQGSRSGLGSHSGQGFDSGQGGHSESAAAPRDNRDAPPLDAGIDWHALACQLPRWLAHCLPPDDVFPDAFPDTAPRTASPAAVAEPAEPLAKVCHLVLRHRALADSFDRCVQQHKRQAIYHLAYGLSHELNNPLANIATRAGLLAGDETHPHRAHLLQTIVNHAMRGSEMLGDLMLVAKPPQLHFRPTRLDQLLERLIGRASAWAADWPIVVRSQLATPITSNVDEAALGEALWAMIRNALEAMPDGGELRIELSAIIDSCPTARIAVIDHGLGLSREALAHWFDPYFSGREAGRGLGLGLTKAQRIVDLHGGQLVLSNRGSGGCVAEIFLPATQVPASAVTSNPPAGS